MVFLILLRYKNPVATHTWQVKDIKVAVIGQDWTFPLVSQTCNIPVRLSWTLDQRDPSLNEDFNEDTSCEEGEDRAIAAVGETVCLFYLGLQTLAQRRKLLVTGVNSLSQQTKKCN